MPREKSRGTARPQSRKTHNSEQATADEPAVVVGFVPDGELAGTNVADAVFVKGSNDNRIVVEQKICLLAPAARLNVPAALAQLGSTESLTVAFVTATGPLLVTVIRHIGWASSTPRMPTGACFTQGPAPPGPQS